MVYVELICHDFALNPSGIGQYTSLFFHQLEVNHGILTK